jgi:hypothetical protein
MLDANGNDDEQIRTVKRGFRAHAKFRFSEFLSHFRIFINPNSISLLQE